MNKQLRWSISTLAAAALLLSACGTDNNAESSTSSNGGSTDNIQCASGSIAGAGSTFVQNIAGQWVKDYQAKCSGSTINYQGVGSSAGITQFTAGTVDFAGSDAALKPEELTAAQAKYPGGVVELPWSAGGIAIEYKLSGVNNLQLSPATLAGLFNGTIKTWNDAAVKADNPSATLPSTPVSIVHRSDGSGTTQAFTEFLTAAAPQAWTIGSGKEVKWPAGQGFKGSDGVTGAVKATEGAISYAEVSFAKANSLGMAKIKNAAGNWAAPDADAVTAALGAATIGSDGVVKLNYTAPDAKAYALSTVTYVMAPIKVSDPAKSALVKSFVSYALEGGQDAASGLSYAELPGSILTAAKANAAKIGA